MPAAANVIDFEQYRLARARPSSRQSSFETMTAGSIAWVPVWFMPVYWVGTPFPQK